MPKSQRKWQSPGIKIQPCLRHGFRRGIDQLVRAIRPTLGPYPRMVVHQTMFQGRSPEFLDNGAIIARRIVMLPDRVEDAAAMILREMLWQVYATAGDGTATAAVLFDSIYDQGLAYVEAGGNALILRRRLEEAAECLLGELDRATRPLSGREDLCRFAESICHDPDLAQVLAEAYDLVGVDGRLEIRSGHGRKLVLELFDGQYWDGGLFSHNMPGSVSGKITLSDPSILVTDLEIKEPDQLAPLLDLACNAGIRDLVLVAQNLSERAAPVLLLPANRRRLQVVAVKLPANSGALPDYLDDFTLLVGGRPLMAATGDRLEAVRLENFGRARRAWADSEYLGIEAGKGDSRKLRRHLAGLRRALAKAQEADDQKRLQQRISRLIPGSAVLWVGATTPVALEARQELAKRTVEAMRGALREGVQPGGGAALLSLRPILQEQGRAAQEDDGRVACKILQKAVEAPTRALVANSGFRPEMALAELALSPPGHGFDVTCGQVRDMHQAGIVDSAAVVKSALGSAIRSAALALTIDVLIQRANPPMGILRQ